MLMIGIQRSAKNLIAEKDILDYFTKTGYKCDDDYISNERGNVGYLIMPDPVNYIVFREEENHVAVFTEVVIPFIRTLTEFDTITVKENEDDTDFIFIGNASEFIIFWDEMGEEEE
jgi:hypothetical protein